MLLDIIYRLEQGISYFFESYNSKDDDLAKFYLKKEEYNLFCQMSSYDKKHSVKVLEKVLAEDTIKEDILMIKLALLHDIGKSKDITFFERILYVLFKKGSKLKKHPEIGYNKIKKLSKKIKGDYYDELKKLILDHHKRNPKNKKIILFQKIDDMC